MAGDCGIRSVITAYSPEGICGSFGNEIYNDPTIYKLIKKTNKLEKKKFKLIKDKNEYKKINKKITRNEIKELKKEIKLKKEEIKGNKKVKQ